MPVSNVRTLFPGTQQSLYEPTVAIDPTDPRVMVAFAIDLSAQNVDDRLYSTIRAFRSTDGGRTWRDRGPMRYGAHRHQVWDAGDPVAAFDSRGVAYFASLAQPPGGTGGIYVHRSMNGGATWARPTLAVPDRCDPTTHLRIVLDKEWLSTDPRSRLLYLTYTGFTVTCTPGGEPALVDIGIFLTTSADRGKRWAQPRRIWHGYGLGAIPQAGPDGALYVTFWSRPLALTRGTDAVVMGRSRDGGRTWRFHRQPVPGFEFGELTKPGSFVGGSLLPSLAVDQSTGSAYIAYPAFVAAENRFTVQLVRSTAGGTSWSSPRRVPTGSADARMPAVLAQGGVVRLVYSRTTGSRDGDDSTPDGTSDEMYVESGDRGQSWSYPFRLSTAHGRPKETTELGDYVGFAAAGGRIAVLWTDARNVSRGTIWSRSGHLF